MQEGIDLRTGLRFKIPGAIVDYRTRKLIPIKRVREDSCPVVDISRGGILFAASRSPKIKTKMSLKLSFPEETKPLFLKGQVTWMAESRKEDYPYELAVRFISYGERKGQNPPAALIRIITLEKKYASQEA